MFDVMTFKRGNVAVFRDRRLTRERVIAERELNGWKVVTLQSHPPATETVVLFGSEKVVTIDAVIDERIANTELSRWLSRSFQETIESVCRQNSAGNADQIGARGAGVRPHQGAS
jgi:hypothetical protein